MAGKSKDEILKVSIVVNGNEGKKAINELEQANRALANSTEDLLKKQKQLEDSRQTETAEYKKLTQEIENNNKGIASNITKMEDHRKTVKLTELTIKELRAEEKRLKDIRDKTAPNSEAYTEYNKQINAVIDRKKELINVSAQTGDAVADMENGFADLGNLLGGLASGNIPMIQQGLRGMAGNISSMTKAALTFIATPIGAAIAVIAGIAIGAKKWIDFNLEVEKSNQLIRDLTQLSGESVDAIRVRAEILKESFGTETQDTIKSAKSLVDGLGISYDEAFDIIENGAIRGKLSNSEFLDSLKEYPVQFKNAGFSAKEFGDIVNAGIDLSIYSDKLPDAIKEFTLAVTEQTPAAREALENAFGKEFTGKLFQDLKDGAITPKEALASIADEATKIGLNSQQAQLLTADLFKGAGEDAGGALKIFEAVNMALNGQAKPLTEIQKLKKEELETNKKLEGIYTQLFASADGGFGQMIAKGKIFATQTLIKILEGGVAVYNWFVDLKNESGLFSAVLTSLGISFKSSFSIIGIVLRNAIEGFKGLGSVIEGVFTLDFKKIKDGYAATLAVIPNMIGDIKDKTVKDAGEIFDALQGKNKSKRIDLKDLVGGGATAPSESGTGTGNENDFELAKKLAADKVKLAEEEVKTKQDNLKKLEDLEAKYEADKLSRIAVSNEAKAQLARDEAIAAATELGAKKELLDLIEAEHKIKIDEGKLKDEEIELKRVADFEARKNALLTEIETAKGEMDVEKELLKAAADYEKQLLELEKLQLNVEEKAELEKLLEEAKLLALAAIKEKYRKKELIEEDKIAKAKKKLQNDILNGAIDLAGRETRVGQALLAIKGALAAKEMLIQLGVFQSKAAIAVGEATTATAVGAANTAKVGFPQNIPLLIAFAAQAVGIISAVKGAVGAAKKTKGFEDGYYPFTRTDGKQFNARYNNSNNTQLVTEPTYFSKGNYLAGEGGPEIIIDTPTLKNLHPSVIENIYATAARTRGYESGNYPTPSTPNMQSGTSGRVEEMVATAFYALIAKLDQPLATGPINIGDNEIARQKIRTDKLTNTRNNAKIK